MTNDAPDQSMEEILASIKRVISADVVAVRRADPADEDSDDDVLELGEAGPPPAPAPLATPAAAAPAITPATAPAEALVSDRTTQASKAALAQLAQLSIDPRADANTLDGMVREMLRPMLKQWLDANLPDLVERIVAREVARVVGR